MGHREYQLASREVRFLASTQDGHLPPVRESEPLALTATWRSVVEEAHMARITSGFAHKHGQRSTPVGGIEELHRCQYAELVEEGMRTRRLV